MTKLSSGLYVGCTARKIAGGLEFRIKQEEGLYYLRM